MPGRGGSSTTTAAAASIREPRPAALDRQDVIVQGDRVDQSAQLGVAGTAATVCNESCAEPCKQDVIRRISDPKPRSGAVPAQARTRYSVGLDIRQVLKSHGLTLSMCLDASPPASCSVNARGPTGQYGLAVPSTVKAPTSQEHTPWWVWFVAAGLLIAGVAIVFAGARIDGLDSYGQSVFVNVGTAFALAGPLFLAERALARRIRRVGETARAAERAGEAAQAASEATRKELDALREQFVGGMNEARAADSRRAERAAAGSFDDLVALYERASRGRSIDRRGLRVTPPSLGFSLRIRAVDRGTEGEGVRVIELDCEDDALTSVCEGVIWSPGETAAEVFVRLAENLTKVGRYPGDDTFDPTKLLDAIAVGLGSVIAIRTGPQGDRDVRQIIKLPNEYWAVTREGLDSLVSTVMWAEHDELIGNTNDAFHRLKSQWQLHSLPLTDFTTAFAVAERTHEALPDRRVPRVGDSR